MTRPCANHKAIPRTCIRYIPSAIDSVSFVLMTLMTCGKKAKVVKIAAILPIMFFLQIFPKKEAESGKLALSSPIFYSHLMLNYRLAPFDAMTSLYQLKDFFGERS